MSKHLIVFGHGAGDSGAVGSGTNERDWLRNKLYPALKKYASSEITFYDTSRNMYEDSKAGKGAYSVSYQSITEFHLDSASPAATGGHVIISNKFNPDAQDNALVNVLKKYAGTHGTGLNKRDDLLNMNVCAKRGISYRLVELGFITNSKDVAALTNNVDQLAKDLLTAIGTKVANNPAPAPSPSPSKPISAIAQEVANGKWGNDPQRSQKLKAAGYDPKAVQNEVNKLLKTPAKPAPAPSKPSNSLPIGSWIAQNGTFTLSKAINLRTSASTSAPILATLPVGSSVKYNAFMYSNGYVWIRQPRGNGYGYLATGNASGHKRTSSWGSFK